MRVADRGLREGILIELMLADGVWLRRNRRRRWQRGGASADGRGDRDSGPGED
jgi:exopolyphosphatase/pppGpp-phosphohydrolase